MMKTGRQCRKKGLWGEEKAFQCDVSVCRLRQCVQEVCGSSPLPFPAGSLLGVADSVRKDVCFYTRTIGILRNGVQSDLCSLGSSQKFNL